MNGANLYPSPTSVAATVAELTGSIDEDCSFRSRERYALDRETVQAQIASQP